MPALTLPAEGTASVISQAHAVDHPECDVDYIKPTSKGSKDDHHVLTHVPTQTKKVFKRHGAHCVWHPTKKEASPATVFVETVEQNKLKFSKCQVKRAEGVRDLLKALMLPTVRDLKKTVQFNLIKNNPCTLEDIQVAEQIWGPDIEPQHLKGRGRRKKPTPSTLDMVKLPPEVKTIHREVHLFMDVMWVCGLPFLTSISANIVHRTATFIEDRKACVGET